MKKIVLAVCAMMMVATPAYSGGLWSMVKNTGLDHLKTKPYVIEVQGVNIRAYVFDVPEMKSVCINVWSEDIQSLECKTYKEMGLEDK